MKALRSTLLAVLTTLSVGCKTDFPEAENEWLREGTPGAWPVARVVDHLQYGGIVFYPESTAVWTALVDLSIFEGFWPDMTGEDAVRAIGPADEYREENGEEFWIYRRPRGRVIVAHKSMGSLFGGWWWRLEAELDPPVSPSELLHSSIVQELPEDIDHRYTVTIMNNDSSDRAPAAWAYIENGRIVRLDISPQGAKGPPLVNQPSQGERQGSHTALAAPSADFESD